MLINPKELLEIFLITYNRANHLDNTLRQFVNCPFARFSITILDNCSTDSTHTIFLKYETQFTKLNYIKNKINIGADANVLRAAELSEGVYTWILADDDEYDFIDCDEVFEVLKKGKADAIMVGCSDVFIWPKDSLCGTPIQLIEKDFAYFGIPSFVPGAIFKTNLFQDQIRTSYTNIVNLFPAMTYYIKLYNEDRLVCVTKSKIVNAAAKAEYHYSFLRVMSALINTFYLIDSPKVRRKALNEVYPNVNYKALIEYAIMMKDPVNLMPSSTVFRYFRLLYWQQKFIFSIAYIGAPVIKSIKYIFRYMKHKNESNYQQFPSV